MACGVCRLVTKGRMSGQSGLGVPSGGSRNLVFVLIVLDGADFTDFASHSKISNFADTHFVDQRILQLDISVDITHCIMEVLKTSHDLPKHHACIVMRKGGVAVAFENIKQGASRTELSNEVIGVGSMFEFEKGKDMFVVKGRPNLGLMVKALRFHFGVWLA